MDEVIYSGEKMVIAVTFCERHGGLKECFELIIRGD